MLVIEFDARHRALRQCMRHLPRFHPPSALVHQQRIAQLVPSDPRHDDARINGLPHGCKRLPLSLLSKKTGQENGAMDNHARRRRCSSRNGGRQYRWPARIVPANSAKGVSLTLPRRSTIRARASSCHLAANCNRHQTCGRPWRVMVRLSPRATRSRSRRKCVLAS